MEGFTYRRGKPGNPPHPHPAAEALLSAGGLLFLAVVYAASCWAYQILTGMGVAGVMHPVNWGIYLVNFVFWVGIAHSGTLISAILYPLPGPLADAHRPARRGHDGFRGHDRRALSLHPPGAGLDLLLDHPLPQPAESLAQFPVSPGLRLGRHLHLPHGEHSLLVHGHDPRPGGRARPRPPGLRKRSTGSSPWAGSAPTTNGAITAGPTSSLPPWPRPW